MQILKFGGTSVGSPERMKHVSSLINDGKRKIVVLSAMSGTTNTLIEIADYFRKGNREGASNIINILRNTYYEHIEKLYESEEMRKRTYDFVTDIFYHLQSLATHEFSEVDEKFILAHGEILSTNMVTNYLLEKNIKVKLLSALDFVHTDANNEPDNQYLKTHLAPLIEAEPDIEIFITQGFICKNSQGEIDNLQRGGSDYTACLIGAALRVEEIQIWTDIDGMHNNDPRFVEGTRPVRQLNFEEAAELAYFGAKILHPTCIQPARFAGVPVRLLNTLEPSAPGTLINNDMQVGTIKAVAAKDNITVVKIVSTRKLLATGFLHLIFETFEKYATPIDVITTSEVGVSVTVDNTKHLQSIIDELKKYGTVVVDRDMCIICIVGDLRSNNIGFESCAANALGDIPIRMISFGGSEHNISFVISMDNKHKALKSLQQYLFE